MMGGSPPGPEPDGTGGPLSDGLDVVDAAITPRRRRTRERLLEAAAEVFAVEGLQGASVEAVCAKAGFSRGAFYSNFDSKEELFVSMLEREFEHRAAELRAHTATLMPTLAERTNTLSAAEAAAFVADFFPPGEEALTWFTLETELTLLAMREPRSAPSLTGHLDRFYESIAEAVTATLHAAGRRFTLPVAHVLPILGGVYERAVRITAIGGATAPGGLPELPGRIAELLFALTEPLEETAATL